MSKNSFFADSSSKVLLRRDSIENLGVRRLAQVLLAEVNKNSSLFETLKELVLETPGEPFPSKSERRCTEPMMVGSSPAMLAIFKMIRKFATSNAPILITGESGTGKELVAQAIHERSSYAAGPFNPINCGGIPASLIASELFGHERGSFTGAHERKIGRIESAAGGTVFLDEIGELPLDLQASLLRFLQEKTIDRIGAQRPIKVDVRVLAATNRNLLEEVKKGRFREDLYYRLNVLEICLPPLRARGEDIDLLCSFFLRQFAQEMNQVEARLTLRAMAAIRSYDWPGNVRELISRLRRAVVMAESQDVDLADLDLPVSGAERSEGPAWPEPPIVPAQRDLISPFDADGRLLSLEEARSRIEQSLTCRALEMTAHNMTAAARELGISRVTLYRLIEKHGLKPLQPGNIRRMAKRGDQPRPTLP